MARIARDPVDRFGDSYVVQPSGCWLWSKALNSSGYGTIKVGSRTDGSRQQLGAHVFSFITFNGPLPEGHYVHHTCFNRACVNPDHLGSVTPSMNTRLKAPGYIHHCSRKTHCPRGHAYDEQNTHIDRKGRRCCRVCGRAKALRQYYAKRAAA